MESKVIMLVDGIAAPAVQIDLKFKTQAKSIQMKVEQMTKTLENLNKQIENIKIEIFTSQLQGANLHDVILV